jgi:glycosyltransferase involved in cell wall biosynthesis
MATAPEGSFRTYVRIDAIDNACETKRVDPASETPLPRSPRDKLRVAAGYSPPTIARRPKVCVCIPTYNAAAFLADAIGSVLAQTFSDFDLIVSDDASDDETPSICRKYDDPRFRASRSDRRLGQAGNWNRCLELASGEYVILLHADDQLLPGYLERAVAILDANEDVGLVHCAVRHVDEAGQPLALQRLFDDDKIDRDSETLRHLLLDGCVISPAGVTVRRAVYEDVGRFTDSIVWGVDWHMWIRVALRHPVAYLSEPLALYRDHAESGTAAVMASGRNARDERWAIEDLFKLVDSARPGLRALKPDAVRGVAHRTWCFAEAMCARDEMAAARAGIRNAIRIWPGMLGESRTWALWAATFTGYRFFAAAHERKQRLAGVFSRGTQAGR